MRSRRTALPACVPCAFGNTADRARRQPPAHDADSTPFFSAPLRYRGEGSSALPWQESFTTRLGALALLQTLSVKLPSHDRRALENLIRDGAISYWHERGTARMGRDATSVVDGELKVHGFNNLRIADESIMPRVTTGKTMAACVVIGERAAEILKITDRS